MIDPTNCQNAVNDEVAKLLGRVMIGQIEGQIRVQLLEAELAKVESARVQRKAGKP